MDWISDVLSKIRTPFFQGLAFGLLVGCMATVLAIIQFGLPGYIATWKEYLQIEGTGKDCVASLNLCQAATAQTNAELGSAKGDLDIANGELINLRNKIASQPRFIESLDFNPDCEDKKALADMKFSCTAMIVKIDGTFYFDCASDVFDGRITSGDRIPFSYNHRQYYFVAEPLKPYSTPRVRISFFERSTHL